MAKLPSRITLPNGLHLELNSAADRRGAEFLIDEIFTRKTFCRDGFAMEPTDVVVDIGANLGVFLLWAAPQVPQGRVVAVEPLPIVEAIARSIRVNALQNATCVQAAVGSGIGALELEYVPGFEMVAHRRGFRLAFGTWLWSGIWWHQLWSGTHRFTARGLSLGQLFEEANVTQVDWLKLDCEGGEYEIFRHATASDWVRVHRLAMEFHEFGPDQHHADLVATLKRHGFNVQVEIDPGCYRRHRTGFIWARRG